MTTPFVMEGDGGRRIELSRLMLGTVQFGLPYGVANQSGQPSLDEVRAIVRLALDAGVNCFDTAATYGTSEAVLGQVLTELNAQADVIVVTKIKPLTPDELANDAQASGAIESSVAESLQRLRRECLPLVLFHRECDARFLDHLLRLKDRGWLTSVGVSCGHLPASAGEFVRRDDVSAVQLPASVLDHRHRLSGVFPVAAERRVAVFVRSVYLQGLLAMPEARIPEKLRDVIPARRVLEDIARQAGLDLKELALRYILSIPGVTSVLTGVETQDQMQDNIGMFARGALPQDVVAAVESSVTELPEPLITPSFWNQ